MIFKNCEELVSLPGFEVEKFTTSVIDLTQDLDTIWKNISKSCRYEIRRAEREGVKVRTSDDWNELYSMYRSFARAKGSGGGWAEMGRENLTQYLRNGTLFTAEFDDHILNGHLYFQDERHMRLIIAPSRRFEREEFSTACPSSLVGHANRLTVWEAIKYAKNAGMAIFDMGGIYTGNDQTDPKYRINQFKFEFGGKLTTVYHYYMDRSRVLKVVKRVKRFANAMLGNAVGSEKPA